MLERKVLICKALGPINAGAASAVAVKKVAALAHEVRDDAVEAAALVALGPTLGVFVLARAVLAEVLSRARHHVGEELESYPAQRLACM